MAKIWYHGSGTQNASRHTRPFLFFSITSFPKGTKCWPWPGHIASGPNRVKISYYARQLGQKYILLISVIYSQAKALALTRSQLLDQISVLRCVPKRTNSILLVSVKYPKEKKAGPGARPQLLEQRPQSISVPFFIKLSPAPPATWSLIHGPPSHSRFDWDRHHHHHGAPSTPPTPPWLPPSFL
jgi:hypothetical protein